MLWCDDSGQAARQGRDHLRLLNDGGDRAEVGHRDGDTAVTFYLRDDSAR